MWSPGSFLLGNVWTQIGETLKASVSDMWVQAATKIPLIGTMLVVLVVGYFAARILSWLTTTILKKLQFDVACEKAGLHDTAASMGITSTVSQIAGKLVFWFVLLMFFVAAADLLGLESVSRSIESLVAYIPSVVGALIILTFGLMMANFIRDMVEGAADRMGIEYAASVGQLVYGLSIIVVGSLAVSQLQLETELVNRIIEISLMACGAALALALGLGTRDIAKHVVAGVYARDSFEPGSRLKVGESVGTLESVRAVNTAIRTEHGVMYIPNGQLMEMEVHESTTSRE